MGIEEVEENDLNNGLNEEKQGTGNIMKKDEIVFILVVFSMFITIILLVFIAAIIADVPFFNKLVACTILFLMAMPVSMGIVEFSKRYKNLSKTENK